MVRQTSNEIRRETWRSLQTNNFAYKRIHKGDRCFYTGLTLTGNHKHSGFDKVTIEHLIARPLLADSRAIFIKKDRGPLRDAIHILRQENIVPSIGIMNSAVGQAPLKVKYGLKEHLSQVTILNTSNRQLIKTYKSLVKNYLKQFQLHGYYCWEWHNYRGGKKIRKEVLIQQQNELKALYMSLLTDEEIKLGAYRK